MRRLVTKKDKIMGAFTSTGAYSTLRSNNGMLNTKRARKFLINDDLIRFKGHNIQSPSKVRSTKNEERVMKLMDQLNDSESQKNILILTISVLTVLLGIAIL